jgi:hypothetical protein
MGSPLESWAYTGTYAWFTPTRSICGSQEVNIRIPRKTNKEDLIIAGFGL